MKTPFLLFAAATLLFLSSCSKDSGKITLTYFEATGVYGNLEDIKNQPINQPASEIINPGKVYLGDDFILIGEEGKGVHVIDNQDLENPNLINFINIPGNREYIVDGNTLYAESYYDVVKIDISDIRNASLISRSEFVFDDEIKNDANETLLGFEFEQVTKEISADHKAYKDAVNHNVVYLDFANNIIPPSAVPVSFAGNSGSANGSVNRLALADDHVYIAARSNIHVIDNSNFEAHSTLINAGMEMETIFPYKDKLFVGTRSSVEIFDIANADIPRHEYTFDHEESCDPVYPYQDVAYVSLRTSDFAECPGNINALIVLDIANLQSPKEVAEIQLRSPYGLSVVGDLLYVGEGENGLSILDASNPKSPKFIVRHSNIIAYDIIAHPINKGQILIAGPDGISNYSVSEDKQLTFKSNIAF